LVAPREHRGLTPSIRVCSSRSSGSVRAADTAAARLPPWCGDPRGSSELLRRHLGAACSRLLSRSGPMPYSTSREINERRISSLGDRSSACDSQCEGRRKKLSPRGLETIPKPADDKVCRAADTSRSHRRVESDRDSYGHVYRNEP
jgi:hypothetical protein